MAYNFNDDAVGQLASDSSTGSSGGATDAPQDRAAAAPADGAMSAGAARFTSCRWQQPKEESTPAFCTHREVKPYAGTASFDPDAWCPDCQYYKLRRAPKKRSPDEYGY